MNTPVKYVCPVCCAVSYNPNDAKHRYCARCNQFEEFRTLKVWVLVYAEKFGVLFPQIQIYDEGNPPSTNHIRDVLIDWGVPNDRAADMAQEIAEHGQTQSFEYEHARLSERHIDTPEGVERSFREKEAARRLRMEGRL